MKLKFVLVLMLLGVFGCSDPIDIPNFDEEAWKKDVQGCSGTRQQLIDNLMLSKEELKGLNSSQIAAILGKPNITELAARNQKYYIYHVSGADACKESTTTSRLSIRFNAVGLSYEVLLL